MALSTIQPKEDRPLSSQEKETIRASAEATLKNLEASIDPFAPSWVAADGKGTSSTTSSRCQFFNTHGFWVEREFVDSSTVQNLKQQMIDLATYDWDPDQALDGFGTDAKSNVARGDYFLDSSDTVHYFAENSALQQQGGSDTNDESTKEVSKLLKPEFQTNRIAALNKAGHAMHNREGAFRDYTLSKQMNDLVQDLGWKDPVVPQSMYIFKQPKIGATVHSHQDSTFLYTTPRQTCLGLWLALDDASLENGCLWVRPGSHREPVRRQFIRNPKYFEQENTDAPKLSFVSHTQGQLSWEGALPPSLEGFLPVEVKAGDLVTFCGTLDHWSLPNFSESQRHTFQLHLVEGPSEGVSWSPSNWLQYPSGKDFLRLRPQTR